MTAEYGDIQIDLPNVNYQKQPGRIQLSMTYVLWSGFSIFEKFLIPFLTFLFFNYILE